MKKAFTLIELLIVCALIVLLSSLTIPHLFFISNASLKRELDVLYSTSAYLQHKAIATNRNQDLIFDKDNNSYIYNGRSGKTHNHVLSKNVIFGFLPESKGPPSKPERAIQKAITFSENSPGKHVITFFPDATTTSGTVYLTNVHKTNMVAFTCPIAPISFIRKYRYENGKWAKI